MVRQLTDEGVTSPLDFTWIAQLRYYWENDTVQVSGRWGFSAWVTMCRSQLCPSVLASLLKYAFIPTD